MSFEDNLKKVKSELGFKKESLFIDYLSNLDEEELTELSNAVETRFDINADKFKKDLKIYLMMKARKHLKLEDIRVDRL